MTRFALGPRQRLQRKTDFQRVYDRRRSVSDSWLIVYACENGLPHSRVGLSVSRKQGPATYRNRLRRLYREAFRLIQERVPAGLDVILIPRTTAEPTLAQVQASLEQLMNRISVRIARERQEQP